LDNYLSAELQTDTAISKDALLKHTGGSLKHDLQSENILKAFNEEHENKTNLTFNDGDDDTQQQNITSAIDDYFIRDNPVSVQQNTVLINFYKDKPEHYKKNDYFEDFVITEIENKNIGLNAEKYDKQIILNTDISEDNTQHTSSGKDPMEITLFPTSNYGHILEEPETINTKNNINISKINRLKHINTSTTKKLPAMNIQEMDNQSTVGYGKNVIDTGKYEHLPKKDVYIQADQSSDPTTAEDHAQPLHEIFANSKSDESRSKRSSSLYPRVASSDSSSSKFPNDNSYLDKGSELRSNSLLKNIRPQKVSQGMTKPSIHQQPEVGQPQADPELDLVKTQFARAERLSKAFKWLIQFVNIVGQVDSYLTDRTRSVIRTVARLYDGDDDRGRYRSCD
jgi:hypothetical protein